MFSYIHLFCHFAHEHLNVLSVHPFIIHQLSRTSCLSRDTQTFLSISSSRHPLCFRSLSSPWKEFGKLPHAGISCNWNYMEFMEVSFRKKKLLCQNSTYWLKLMSFESEILTYGWHWFFSSINLLISAYTSYFRQHPDTKN